MKRHTGLLLEVIILLFIIRTAWSEVHTKYYAPEDALAYYAISSEKTLHDDGTELEFLNFSTALIQFSHAVVPRISFDLTLVVGNTYEDFFVNAHIRDAFYASTNINAP